MTERPTQQRVPWRIAEKAAPWPPSADASALGQLRRLLYLLPLAASNGETTLDELAAELGVDPATVEADLKAVAERTNYLPAGAGSDLQIILDGDRVYVWTKGEFSRPLRLTAREALALALGLRMAALSPGAGDDRARDALRRRLEGCLASESPGTLALAFDAPDWGSAPQAVRETLLAASRDRHPCTISYLKPGSDEPEDRRIHPYAIVQAEGHWHVLAHCEKATAVRNFRLDRILDAAPVATPFHESLDFDPGDYLQDGRAFSRESDIVATVRYSPGVARWVAEQHEGQWEQLDGSLVVDHRVANPTWLVRHVLGYAGEAEVLSPLELRDAVRETAERMLAG